VNVKARQAPNTIGSQFLDGRPRIEGVTKSVRMMATTPARWG
jgi:hypothetical protein